MWYIFLDDERDYTKFGEPTYTATCHRYGIRTPITAKDYPSMIQLLEDLRGSDIIVDFDHDLGMGKNGYDVAKWIVENNYPLTAFHIHTQNPVGRLNIRQLLTHYGYIGSNI